MITYFSRHTSCGFSIQRVFGLIINEVKTKKNVKQFSMPSKRSRPIDIIINAKFTNKNRNKNGINHITGHIHDVVLGLVGAKTILTIHDLVFIDNVTSPIKKIYKWFFWIYLPLKLSDYVVCISEHTKQNLLKYVKETKKIKVIHNPIDPKYSFVHKEFNDKEPIILHIGTGWNKNIDRVILSLAGIPCHLRIVGKLSVNQHKLLQSANIEYSNVFNLSDDEIKHEYIKSDIVSFPSEYEGFGMPIIEAQKIGRIVVTSKIEPLIEVSGNAVCYVEPKDVLSIKNGFLKAIQDKTFRETTIEKGKVNVERFNITKIADQYLDLYKKLLS